MIFGWKKYRQDEGNTGGASGTSSSGESSSSDKVEIGVDDYNTIVDEIETQKELIIATTEGYVEHDAVCNLNSVIPDYEQADHEVEDMLRLMQKETDLVIDTMRTIRAEFEEIDSNKTNETLSIY